MKYPILLFALLCGLNLSAQFDHAAPLNTVARYELPLQDNKALLQAELDAREPGRAPHFAVPLGVHITPETHGTWETLPDGRQLWRLRVRSRGAESLNFGFTEYHMPEGGELYLDAIETGELLGPFTPADNEEHDQLWTPLLRSQEIVLILVVPQPHRSELRLTLSSINHDFMGAGMVSGSCNLDVVCGTDDGWDIVEPHRDIIQSVALLQMGGFTFCTGFLVANTSGDCRPLFITADHCGVNAGNAATLVTIWNYENSTCRQPNSPASGGAGDGVTTDFNTGAIFRSAFPGADMTLVELDDPVSETAEAFFAGWSAEMVESPSAIGIHHPSTDEKRISFENDPTNIDGNFMDVNDWDVGTTEGGSSGSPLFDNNERVIGQLFGGGAACGNDLGDTYGAIFASWEGGGTPQSRLRDWLDPLNTGQLVLDGYSFTQCGFFVGVDEGNLTICASDDLVYTLSVSDGFTAPVTLTVSDLPPGTTATIADNPVTPGASTTVTITGTAGISGDFDISLNATDGTNVFDGQLVATIDPDLPAAPTPTEPADGEMDVAPQPDFMWNAAANSSTFDVQVATDPDFNNVIDELTNIEMGEETVAPLASETEYFWRVRASNACGTSAWSEVHNFTTGNCSLGVSADVPVNISPQGTPTISSQITIDYSGTISDLDVVNVVGVHSWLDDLTFTLTSPAGTSVVLVSEECGSNENFNITFDDEGAANFPCPYNDGGSYMPEGSLSDFNGENPQGVWTLTIDDDANQDGGSLNSWGLQICAEGVFSGTVQVNASDNLVCNTGTVNYDITVSEDFNGPVTITATSDPIGLNGDLPTTTVDPGATGTLVLDELFANSGFYELTFTATDGENITTTTAELTVDNGPNLATLTSPANQATEVALQPNFAWNGAANADTYSVELATDIDFTNVIFSETTTDQTFVPSIVLDENTQYFWRILSENDCGSSASSIRSFTTEMASSVNELSLNDWAVFPNPVSREAAHTVRVQFVLPITSAGTLELIATDGRLLHEEALSTGTRTLDLSLPTDRSAGVYFLRVRTADAVGVRSLIVE